MRSPKKSQASKITPRTKTKTPVSRTLDSYTSKELVTELRKRLKSKKTRYSEVLRSKPPVDPADAYEVMSREEEMRYVQSLESKGRTGTYRDNSISTTERLAEKMWWWLSEQDHKTSVHWANVWIEDHPAHTVGKNNLSNREVWLEKTLKKIPKGSRILDAGAGELQYKRLCSHLDYVSQDFGGYNGEGNAAGLQMGTWDNSKLDIVSDIASIPVKDASFDAIMCIEVFEHISNPNEALEEFSRILRPGGKLIITTPFCAMTHFAPYFFYNGYSRYYYEKMLPSFDFEVKEISLNGNYFEYLAQEVRRLDEIAARYAPGVPAPSPFDDILKQRLLCRLEELSKQGSGSSELLVQGVQVVGVKK